MIRQYLNKIREHLKSHPQQYKQFVLALGLLWYLYIFFILALLLVLILFLAILSVSNGVHGGVFKLIFVVGALAYVLVRALWVKLSPPIGFLLRREQAPRLFEFLDQLSKKVKGFPVHQVLITDDFNASAAQLPRWGLFGGYRNYLCLGLPLLACLSAEQIKAVIAHEMGHFSHADGQTGCWIYRIRQSLYRLSSYFEYHHQFGDFLVRWFLKRFVPVFDEFAYALFRQDEYEADRFAATYSTPYAFGQALLWLNVGDKFLNDFWPALFKSAKDSSQLPDRIFDRVFDSLQKREFAAQAGGWIREFVTPRTAPFATHPSLRDRLEAIGFKVSAEGIWGPQGERVEIAQPTTTSAAQDFLTPAVLASVTEKYNAEWNLRFKYSWEKEHEFYQSCQEQWEELSQLSAARELTLAEQLQFSRMTFEIKNKEDAVILLKNIVARWPDNLRANHSLGSILIDQQDEAGILYFEKALQQDPVLRHSGYLRLAYFYELRGDYIKSDEYVQKAKDSYAVTVEASKERDYATVRDKFAAPDIDEEKRQKLISFLQTFGREIRQAYFVKRILKHGAHIQSYLLYVQPRYKWFIVDPKKSAEAFSNRLNVASFVKEWEQIFVVVSEKHFLWRISRVKGVLHYRNFTVADTVRRICLIALIAVGVFFLGFLILDGTKNYPNGQVRFDRSYVNGKLEGITTEYFQDGKVKVKWNYHNGVLQGLTKKYYPTGELKWDLEYRDGKMNGLSKGYFPNGKLKGEWMMANGLKNGLGVTYYENGNVRSKQNWVNEREQGKGWGYMPDGILKYEYDYSTVNGHKVLTTKEFTPDGRLISETTWKDKKLINKKMY